MATRPGVSDFAARTLKLPQGRAITVREVTPRDTDSLCALFTGLGEEARRRRFFAGGPPPRQVVDRMACVADRGGFGLVAEVDPEGPSARIVAEASFNRLDNGDAELGMTVADGWRGWLGPYLLSLLAGVAEARGVANFEADVLADNAPMLAVLRARGAVVMRRPEWTVVRLLVGTSPTGPVWPAGGARPRIVVETQVAYWHALEAVRRSGAEVLVCGGPRSSSQRCPALNGRPCPLAADADLIVMSRPPDDGRWRALRAAHGVLHAGVPVCVEGTRGSLVLGSVATSAARSVRRALRAVAGR